MNRPTHTYTPTVTVRNATTKAIAPWLSQRQSTMPPKTAKEADRG